jgi:Protein of unknown function (DUF992)
VDRRTAQIKTGILEVMTMRTATWAATLSLALATFLAPAAQAQDRVQAGVLACNVAGGIGVIIGSQKAVSCTFSPAGGRPAEHYYGEITKFGLDIGATTGGRMVWTVFAPTRGFEPGGLAGSYAGASGEATIAAGLGANVLVGGSHRTIALQPVSVSGQTGLNLAVGVAQLNLRPAP